MRKVSVNFYLEKNLTKSEHRLYVRVGYYPESKKIYSVFLVPEACFIKEENRTITRSNNSKFVSDKRYFSKSTQANEWIEDMIARCDEINSRIQKGEKFDFTDICSFMANEVSDLKVSRDSELLFSQFIRMGFEEHKRARKLEGKPLGPNTLRNYDYYCRKYSELVGESVLAIDFDQNMVDEVTERLFDENTMVNTSKRSMLSPVKKMLTRAMELKIMPSSYVLPKLPNIKDSEYDLKVLLSVSQIEEIKNLKISAAKARQGRDAFLMSYFGCGMRMNEAIAIRMSFVNPQMMTFQYYMKKVKKMSKVFQMSKRLWEIIEPYYDATLPPETFLLPCMRDWSHYSFHEKDLDFKINETRNYFNGVLKGIATKLKFPEKFSTHSARKSFAVHAYELLRDVYKVKEMLGHTKIETTIVYLAKNGIHMIQENGDSMDIFDKMYEKEKLVPANQQKVIPIKQTGS